MKTEVLNMNFTLIDIIRFQEIDSPLFQRPYQWGIKNKSKNNIENKPVEYFKEFLSNQFKSLFLGTVFIHSKNRYDYTKENKKEFCVKLSDGQHRLGMSIISLEVVKDILMENKEVKENTKEITSTKYSIDIFSYIEDILDSSNLKIMKEDLSSDNLIKLLRKDKDKVSNLISKNIILEKRIIELIEDKKTKITIKEIQENNTLQRECKNKILDNNKEILNIEKESAIYSSYKKVKDFINNLKGELKKAMIISNFIDRFKNFKMGLIVLQPDQSNNCISELEIENEAFLMFNQQNAQAVPLNPHDLFISLLSKESKSEELNKLKKELKNIFTFDKNTKIYEILKYFNINKNNILDFIMKMNSQEQEHYIYVNKLYDNEENNLQEKIKEINLCFKTIEELYNNIEKKIKLKFLFKFYFNNNNTLPIFIFILKILKENNIKNIDMSDKDYKELFKIIVLLSIMATYIPDSGKRPNLARDLNKKNTIKEVYSYIESHFESKDEEDLINKIKEHLKTFEFGNAKHRSLAKLLFICEISDSINGSLIERKDVHYEHIFPLKYDSSAKIDNLEDKFKVKYDSFSLEADNAKTLDLLGNATILSGKENKKLSNLSPFEKSEKYKNGEINKNSCINQNHLEYLLNNSKEWGKEVILERTEIISNNILNFLFK